MPEVSTLARSRLGQIFRFLKGLNEHSNPAVLDVDGQPWLYWLDHLPDHPSIAITSPFAAKPETTDHEENAQQQALEPQVVLRVRRPTITRPADPPPLIREWLLSGWDNPEKELGVHKSRNEVNDQEQSRVVHFEEDTARIQSFETWRIEREKWRQPETLARQALRVFEKLYELHGRLERDGDKQELVLGDGVLSWARESNVIFHPTLLQRVQLHFDTQKPEFTVTYGDSDAELYAGVFQAVPEINGARVQQLRKQVEEGSLHPLAVEADGFLRQFAVILSPQGEFLEAKRPAKNCDPPRVGRAPLLFLRNRTLGFAQAIDDTLQRIQETPDVCVGLLNIIGCHPPIEASSESPETPDAWQSEIGHPDILFGKESNLEQIQIASRLDRHGAVLVQGPPGTGKSHTIANLIGHLLAHNKSVLVTSHTTKALRVLRNHVVEPLQPLCVSVLERDAQSRDELKASVEAIQERLSSSDAAMLEREATRLAAERRQLLKRLDATQRDLLQVRSNEFRDIVISGEPIGPSVAARIVAEGRGHDDWMPGPIPLDAPLPLSQGELVELYATNELCTSEDDEYIDRSLPSVDQLLNIDEFKSAVEASAQLGVSLPRRETELWANLQFTGNDLQQLEVLIDLFRHSTEEHSHFQGWQRHAVEASLGQLSDREVWDHLLAKIREIADLVSKTKLLRLRYAPSVERSTELTKQITSARAIAEHLKSGGGLGWFTLTTKPLWKHFLREWRVLGNAPSQAEHFEAIESHLLIAQQREELAILWDGLLAKHGEQSFAELGDAPEQACQECAVKIEQCVNWWQNRLQPQIEQLRQRGFQWDTLIGRQPPVPGSGGKAQRILAAIQMQLIPHLEEVVGRLRKTFLRNRLEQQVQLLKGWSIPIAEELSRATVGRKIPAYAHLIVVLNGMHARRSAALRRNDLLVRLSTHAPTWATSIRHRVGPHGSPQVPGNTASAWKWRQLHDELERRETLKVDALSTEADSLRLRLKECTVRLIENKAWANQVRRTTHSQRQALFGWADTIRRLGAGFVRRANQLSTQARNCMRECRQAVPVWIVPISRLAESFDFSKTTFDVLIIDEASQCDLMGLLALGLAKQIVIVGDHEQVSPLAVGKDMDVVTSLINQHLDGIPSKELYDGKTSVYHLARQSFGGMICLREHFRCVPNIIQFSNSLCYEGRIKPLRDPASSPLVPSLVPYRVEGATRDGKANAEEALAVASLLVAAARHAAYADQTFGVISLLGDEQAGEIDTILQSRLSTEEYASRRIICGNPAQFQGDERDVVFLTMVDVPGEGPLRTKRDDATKQRFNVAASRARNQLWVIHSVDKDRDLQPDDLRRRLLDHAFDPEATQRAIAASEDRTESEFERQVFERLVNAGYRVTPQWEVGAYRIDFVVEGNGKRLAVECDGDRFHPPEQLPHDMARQSVLERLGWRFHRIRGSKYFRDPDGAMGKLFVKLAAMGITPGLENTDVAPSSDVIEELKREAYSLRTKWALDDEVMQQEPAVQPETSPVANKPMIAIADAPFREAWQLPLAEWKALRQRLRAASDQVALTKIGGLSQSDFAHKVQVMNALKGGKEVPEAVLRDYPDLLPRG